MGNISKVTLPDNTSWGLRAGYIPFGKVDSTSTNTAFTATVEGITELIDGACCYLMNGVVTSASGWTLNVNGLGAKPVYQTLASSTATSTIFNVNYTMLFVYNSQRVSGGCWDIFYGYNSNTTYSNASLGQGYGTCSTAEATVAKVVTLSSYALTTGGIVAVKFTNAVPANATLNINSKGAKAIYYRGSKIIDGIIGAGDIAYFIYSTYYHLLGIDGAPGGYATEVGTIAETSGGTNSTYSRSNHVHGIRDTTIVSALGYTPYDSSNPSGYTSNTGTITGVSVNGTSVATSGVADVTVPTAGTTATDVSSTSSSGGSASTYSRSDHVHSISAPTINYALGYAPYDGNTNPLDFLQITDLNTRLFFFAQVSGSTTDYNLRETMEDPMPAPVTFTELVCTSPVVKDGYLLDRADVKVYFAQGISNTGAVFWGLYDVDFATRTITLSRFDETTHSQQYATFTSALDGNNEELPLVGSITTQTLLTSGNVVTSFNGNTGDVTYTAPVTSVNGSTGAVTVSVPTKTSDLTNDSGFITNSVNGDFTVEGTGHTLYLHSAPATNSPCLIFQRGTLTDNYNDWQIQDRSGYLYFDERGNGSTAWTNRVYFDTTGTVHCTTLDGSLAWSKVTSKPTIPDSLAISGNTISLKSGSTVMSSITLPTYTGAVT